MEQGQGLCAIRYPRGKELYKPSGFHSTVEPVAFYGPEDAPIALVTYGRLFSFAAECAERLGAQGLPVRVVKLNRIVPIDPQAVQAALSCRHVFFFEEGIRQGGIGEEFSCLLQEAGFAGACHLHAVEDPFVRHAPMFRSLEALGLNAAGMERAFLAQCDEERGGARL